MKKVFIIFTLIALSSCYSKQQTSKTKLVEFDKNPSKKTGIVSIGKENCGVCGGENNEISVDLPNPGDFTHITIYLDYKVNQGSKNSIKNAKAYYKTKNINGTKPKYSFEASLKGDNTKEITDNAIIKGLPSSYSIEFIIGHIENNHNKTDPNVCGKQYEYKREVTNDIFSNDGQIIGDLSTDGETWCSQGSVAVKYKITNTAQ